MSHIISIPNMRDGYVDLCNWVLEEGKEVAPRGYKTREIEDATFILENPTDALPVGVGRSPKLEIPAAEALLLCGGISSPSLLVGASKQFRRFLDGGSLHGGYGERIRFQLPAAADRLRNDPDTRQAIVQIWDPARDGNMTEYEPRDLPCTLNFGFRIRDGKLNMSATMRSNDVYLGAAYDVFMFTQLQCTLARVLDVPVGTYTHHAYSFHAYERNFEQIQDLHVWDPHSEAGPLTYLKGHPQGHPQGFGFDGVHRMGSAYYTTEYVQSRARKIYDGDEMLDATKSEQWYIETLKDVPRLSAMENFTS